MNKNSPNSEIFFTDEIKKDATIPIIRHPIKEFHSFEIKEEELETLKESAFIKAFYTCGLSVSLTAFFSFLGIILIVNISDPIKFAIFFSIIIISIGFSIIFGYLLCRCKDNLEKLIKKIKAREPS